MSALRVGLSGRLPFSEANFFISGTFHLRKNGTFKFASYIVLVADGVSRCREGYPVVYSLSYPISCCIVAVIRAKGSIAGTAKHIRAVPRHGRQMRHRGHVAMRIVGIDVVCPFMAKQSVGYVVIDIAP